TSFDWVDLSGEKYFASIGELHRVTEQVHNDLTEAIHITKQKILQGAFLRKEGGVFLLGKWLLLLTVRRRSRVRFPSCPQRAKALGCFPRVPKRKGSELLFFHFFSFV